ncbi:hypothetical protein AB4Z10_11050 [Bosea sp. RAF48]|uniref:hypothetical protein n=1 Tax=Bosea sp. RAF48 TaxID=3237480 RepID=UPI003F927B13
MPDAFDPPQKPDCAGVVGEVVTGRPTNSPHLALDVETERAAIRATLSFRHMPVEGKGQPQILRLVEWADRPFRQIAEELLVAYWEIATGLDQGTVIGDVGRLRNFLRFIDDGISPYSSRHSPATLKDISFQTLRDFEHWLGDRTDNTRYSDLDARKAALIAIVKTQPIPRRKLTTEPIVNLKELCSAIHAPASYISKHASLLLIVAEAAQRQGLRMPKLRAQQAAPSSRSVTDTRPPHAKRLTTKSIEEIYYTLTKVLRHIERQRRHLLADEFVLAALSEPGRVRRRVKSAGLTPADFQAIEAACLAAIRRVKSRLLVEGPARAARGRANLLSGESEATWGKNLDNLIAYLATYAPCQAIGRGQSSLQSQTSAHERRTSPPASPAPLWTVWAEPETFDAALRLHMARHRESIRRLHAALASSSAPPSLNTLAHWYRGASKPATAASFSALAAIERRYVLPQGYFAAKLPNQSAKVTQLGMVPLPQYERRRLAWHLPADFARRAPDEQQEILTWVRRVIISGSTEYRRYQSAAAKQRYALRFTDLGLEAAGERTSTVDRARRSALTEAPARLRREMLELLRFKTSTLTAAGLRRNGVWNAETASQKVEHFALMFGALTADPKGDVAGFGATAKRLTFAMLVFPAVWDWYLGWRERRRGFFTQWEVDMLVIALSLVKAETGWLRQTPALATNLEPIPGLISAADIATAKADWYAACDAMHEHGRNRIRELLRVIRAGKLRDPGHTGDDRESLRALPAARQVCHRSQDPKSSLGGHIAAVPPRGTAADYRCPHADEGAPRSRPPVSQELPSRWAGDHVDCR